MISPHALCSPYFFLSPILVWLVARAGTVLLGLGGRLQVGFAPRKLHPDGGYWNAEPHQNGIYNTLFPTKGAFLHKRFYELYWAPKLEWVRKLLQFRFIYLLGDYASVMVKMVAPDLLSDDFPPACLPAADTGPAGQPTPVIPCPRRPSATPAGPQHHRHECHCGGHPHELNPRHRNRAGTF